ncbi:MAG: hypothetical protein K2W96_12850 [Gemmataceae bacterium]|nr:hypothetical protein [Gemmataceae bacterium]
MRWLLRWFSRTAWSEWFDQLVSPDPYIYSGPTGPEALQDWRNALLRHGTGLYGEPTKEQQAALERIESMARLLWLAHRTLDADTWDELLAE